MRSARTFPGHRSIRFGATFVATLLLAAAVWGGDLPWWRSELISDASSPGLPGGAVVAATFHDGRLAVATEEGVALMAITPLACKRIGSIATPPPGHPRVGR